MIIVYALLDSHPAATECEAFIKQRQGWITSALHLLEAYSVLTKIYSASPADAAQAIQNLLNSPLQVLAVEGALAEQAVQTAVRKNLDLTDAVLLEVCRVSGAKYVATEDAHLIQVCIAEGLLIETPLDDDLRRQVSLWEATHLPQKGISRILRRVHTWLNIHSPDVAALFWNHTGGGSHLP